MTKTGKKTKGHSAVCFGEVFLFVFAVVLVADEDASEWLTVEAT